MNSYEFMAARMQCPALYTALQTLNKQILNP
jgi:hypothetical protein